MVAALVAVAGMLALGGCRSEVATTVEPTGPSSATLTISAVFTDEAAQVIGESAEARTGLEELFTSRTGSDPELSVTTDRVVASAEVTYENLAQTADITGVASVKLTQEGGLTTVEFVPATRLASTIAAQNVGEPDEQALTETMLANTHLVLTVRYGSVDSAVVRDAGGKELSEAEQEDVGAQLRVEGGDVVFDRTADSELAGTLVVAGSRGGVSWLLLLGVATLGGATVWWWRRRPRRY